MKGKIFAIFLFIIGVIIVFQLIKLLGDIPFLTGEGVSTQEFVREVNVLQD